MNTQPNGLRVIPDTGADAADSVTVLVDYTSRRLGRATFTVTVTDIQDAYGQAPHDEADEPDLRLMGFCHELRIVRAFRSLTIHGLAYAGTGEVIANPIRWMLQSPYLAASRQKAAAEQLRREAVTDMSLRARLMIATARAHKPLRDRRGREFRAYLAEWAMSADPSLGPVDEFVTTALNNHSGTDCLLLELADRCLQARRDAMTDATRAAERDGISTAQADLLARAARQLGI